MIRFKTFSHWCPVQRSLDLNVKLVITQELMRQHSMVKHTGRTGRTFRFDFPGNLWLAAFAILAMFCICSICFIYISCVCCSRWIFALGTAEVWATWGPRDGGEILLSKGASGCFMQLWLLGIFLVGWSWVPYIGLVFLLLLHLLLMVRSLQWIVK